MYVFVFCFSFFFFFKQKTAYEMRISDWSSDVCSADRLISSQFLDSGGRKAAMLRRLAFELTIVAGYVPGAAAQGVAEGRTGVEESHIPPVFVISIGRETCRVGGCT